MVEKVKTATSGVPEKLSGDATQPAQPLVPAPAEPAPEAPHKPKPPPEPERVSDNLVCLRVDTVAEADAVEQSGLAAMVANDTGSVVVVVVGGIRLEALDDEIMAAHGWVRAAPARTEPADLLRVVSPQ